MKNKRIFITTIAALGVSGLFLTVCALLLARTNPQMTSQNASAVLGKPEQGNGAIAPVARNLAANDRMPPPTIAPTPVEYDQRPEQPNQLMPNTVVLPIGELLHNVNTPVPDWREFKPASITIAPTPRLEVNFEMSSVRTEHDRTIWVGRSPGLPGAFLVSVATGQTWHAIVSYGMPSGESFRIRAEGNTAEVTEQSTDFMCATPDEAVAAERVGVAGGELTPGLDKAAAHTADKLQVDVLFFYDKAMLLTYSKGDIKSMMINTLEVGNLILEQSGIDDLPWPFRWRFLECYEVPEYETCSGLEEDLAMMADPSTLLGEYVEMRRTQHHADQMQLWLRFGRDDGVAGIARLDGYHSVVATTYYQTSIHELGHNFGCQHDRDETSSGASDDDGKYNYAWSDKGEAKHDESDPNEEPKPYYYGTIMSYARTARFDYFSNPDVEHTYYDVLGRLKTSPMGYYTTPAGYYHPKAAFNALQLSRHALWMSIVGDPPSHPKILAQPQSVAMGIGSVATLQVYASSPPKAGTVRYQWRKGINVLSGATTDRLVISANTTADGGIYYVDIANEVGMVTSNPATVTVTTVPGGPTYTSTEGGGGAASVWFLSGLILLCILRIFMQRK